MRLKKYITIFSLIIVIPTFSLIASCQSAKPIEITYTTLVLNEGSSISFSFKNVQETDHITCTSDYDSAPGHLGYFFISSYNKASNQITLTRNDVEITSEIICPVVFWNKSAQLKTVNITLTPSIAKPIEITYITSYLYENSSISFSFANVTPTDHITCTSDYDSAPGHLGYFSISPYDTVSNQITLSRSDTVTIDSEVKCPVIFWNNGEQLKTIDVILPPSATLPIEITWTTSVLNENDSIAFSFKNVRETDHITCTSDYDSAPGHLGYFFISSYDTSLRQITLTRNDVEITSEIICPVIFWNNGEQLDVVDVTLSPSTNIDYDGYINDRTVSLYYRDSQYVYRGTGWIINKENETDNYRYWLATNFHVIANLPKLETYHHLYYGSTPNESAAQVNINSYTNFNSFSIDKILYSDTATVTTDDNVTGNPGNDMAIIDVNFGTNLSSSVKSKLDKLNTEWQSSSDESGKRHINTFIDWRNNQIAGPYHWGGYPVVNASGAYLNDNYNAEWETDQITNINKNSGGDNSKDRWHGTTSSRYDTVVDVSPQIYSNENKINSKMGGGASGSMVIDRDKKIVGIYWGGWGISQSSFNPYFDVFNDSSFSYLGKYATFLQSYMYS